MAKQVGPLFFTGSMGDLCFYKMDGEYYVRMKSSLSGKRVKKDPRFRRTMAYAGLMAQASRIASGVYRALPVEGRKHTLYRKLTGEALRMLKEGVGVDEVKAKLYEGYIAVKEVKPAVIAGNVKARGQEPEGCRRLYVSATGLLRVINKIIEHRATEQTPASLMEYSVAPPG